MKKKQLFTLLLSIVLTVSMCLAGTTAAFAGTDEGESASVSSAALTEGIAASVKAKSNLRSVNGGTLYNGSTITATNINGEEDIIYVTQSVTKSTTYKYNIYMPKTGTLAVKFYEANGTSGYAALYNASGSYISSSGTATADDGTKIRYYHCGAGTVQLEVYLSTPSTGYNQAAISAVYAPDAAATVKLGKNYYHGSPSYDSVTSFKVTVPSTGYLTLTMGDGGGDEYFSIRAKTSGFKDYEYFSSKDNVKWIGVKKGTYTFSVKSSSPIYGINAKFTKVKESKYGTKKKKAVTLKKKKASKGLIITNAKKVHWYKFKNPKTQKVKVVVGTKITDAGGYGGIRVTAYYGKASTTRSIYSDTKTTTIQLYNKGKKLKKGTYYIKVESYNKGSGYFTIKWK